MEKENSKRKISIIITSVALVILLGISFTYAYFSSNKVSTENSVIAGTLVINYEDDSLNTLSLNNIVPIHDSEIKTKANKIGFKVNNTGSSKAYVDINLTDIVMDNELSNLEFKWALYSGDTKISNGNLRNVSDNKQLLINNIEIESGFNKSYELYIWISETDTDQSKLMNKNFSAKITVNGNQKKGKELLSKVIKDNNSPIDTTTPNFANKSTTDDGLIQGIDKDGETYYFRGAVEDNYVKIGNRILSDERGIYISNNTGKDNTIATSKIVFTPTSDGTIKFDWEVSSQYYDKLNIKLNGTNIVTDQSEEKNGTVDEAITSGTEYTLEFSYSKNSWVSGYEDKAVISNLSITSIENPEWITEGDYGFEEGKLNYFLWRIVRINGDGTIRLISQDQIGTGYYNTVSDDNKYLGYTYLDADGVKQDSNAKKIIDKWYNDNLTEYDSLIATTTFCNDTSASTLDSNNFSAQERLEVNKKPTFKCSETDKNYGGVYKLKAGLITADETVFAGAVYGTSNNSYYLYNSSMQYSTEWTMTPWKSTSFISYLGSGLGVISVNNGPGFPYRIVINLKSDTPYKSGDGTIDNPYLVSLTN